MTAVALTIAKGIGGAIITVISLVFAIGFLLLNLMFLFWFISLVIG